MAKLRFLAPSADPRPGKEGTVYGAGHETDFDQADYDFVKSLLLDGKAEITDNTPPADILLAPAPPA